MEEMLRSAGAVDLDVDDSLWGSARPNVQRRVLSYGNLERTRNPSALPRWPRWRLRTVERQFHEAADQEVIRSAVWQGSLGGARNPDGLLGAPLPAQKVVVCMGII